MKCRRVEIAEPRSSRPRPARGSPEIALPARARHGRVAGKVLLTATRTMYEGPAGGRAGTGMRDLRLAGAFHLSIMPGFSRCAKGLAAYVAEALEDYMDISELLAFVVKNKAPTCTSRPACPDDPGARRCPAHQLRRSSTRTCTDDLRHHERRAAEALRGKPRVRLLVRDPGLARFRVNAFVQQRGAAA